MALAAFGCTELVVASHAAKSKADSSKNYHGFQQKISPVVASMGSSLRWVGEGMLQQGRRCSQKGAGGHAFGAGKLTMRKARERSYRARGRSIEKNVVRKR